jgi:hypothetical protein
MVSCEHGNEPLDSTKWCEFVEWLDECWLLKEGLGSMELSYLAHVTSAAKYNVFNIPNHSMLCVLVTPV